MIAGRTSPPGAARTARIALRPYRGLEEIPGMAAANAALRREVGVLQPVDPEAMRHAYTHLVNSDPTRDCIVAERDGRTVGYARVEWHDLTDGDRSHELIAVVEPSAWGHGTAATMVDWCERRLREVAARYPTDRRAWYTSYVFRGDTELEGALAAAGYRTVRWEVEMLRPDLDDIPGVGLPHGYALRSPTEPELPAVFEMNVVAFAEHWGEWESTEQRLGDWIEDPRFRRDLVVVAWAGDRPAACVANVLEHAPDGSRRGLLDGVATHPGHRRRGLARAAIAESLRRLREAGATSAYLGVDTDNPNRALRLYESCGFRVASWSDAYRKPFPGSEAVPR